MQIAAIQKMIVEVRGQRVMLDVDIAELYGVPTKALNQAVKRNSERFPEEFMFQLDQAEWEQLKGLVLGNRSQIVTGSQKHRTALPYVFTEYGVAMLASILKSEKAIAMNIAIVQAFIGLRKILTETNKLAETVIRIKETVADHDEQLKKIFAAIRALLLDRAKQKKWEDRPIIGFNQKQ
jgi:phage regulator Rha-like protein